MSRRFWRTWIQSGEQKRTESEGPPGSRSASITKDQFGPRSLLRPATFSGRSKTPTGFKISFSPAVCFALSLSEPKQKCYYGKDTITSGLNEHRTAADLRYPAEDLMTTGWLELWQNQTPKQSCTRLWTFLIWGSKLCSMLTVSRCVPSDVWCCGRILQDNSHNSEWTSEYR